MTVTSKVKPRSIFSLCLIFFIGTGTIVWPYLLNHPHKEHNTFDLILGGIFIVIALLSLLAMKKVTVDESGVRVDYYVGRGVFFQPHEIVRVTGKVNLSGDGPIGQPGKSHQVVIVPGNGQARVVIGAASMTNFDELYRALEHFYGDRMENK